MTEEALVRFREVFWDAFHRPKLHSEKFLSIWQSLEPVNEQLSGPLSTKKAIATFFSKTKTAFPG